MVICCQVLDLGNIKRLKGVCSRVWGFFFKYLMEWKDFCSSDVAEEDEETL